MTEEILYSNRTRNAEEKSRRGKFKFGSTAVLLVYYYIIFLGTGGPRGCAWMPRLPPSHSSAQKFEFPATHRTFPQHFGNPAFQNWDAF